MLPMNKFMQIKLISNKFIYILVTIIFLSCLFLSMMNTEVKAAQYTEKYSSSSFNSSKYPGYRTLIDSLKKAHPNWTFTILYTDLDWNQVLKNETTAKHGRNLVSSSKTGEWVCSVCGDKKYDNGSWKCASEATVAYYMDPRNSLFEDYVFQFENLQWADGVYTVDGVKKIIADCQYLQGDKITYTKTDGKTGTINKSYAQVIYDAAKANNISPYHVASRVRMEQGPGKNPSSTATGKYSGYVGYYNFYNINASGNTSSEIIKNALKYAKDKGWSNPEKAIYGGASFLASSYINRGQNTGYLQKFDVDNSDGSLYWHQYQQNVSAAKTESSSVLKTYKSIDSSLSWSFNFVIPVFKNMPETRSPQPGSQSIVTQNIQLTQSTNVYSSRSTSSSKVGTISKDGKVLRIEIGNTKTNGYYWDKVVLDNGKKGYVISSGIKLLDDITNCNIRGTATEPGNVRNGPGTSGTTVITTLTVGQNVIIVEKDKYKNIDGENWTRIYLSDGRQGYIVSRYLKEISDSDDGNTTPTDQDTIKVITSSGLSVREHPGTNQKILTYALKGDLLTRIEKEVSNNDGYVWDKVITEDGIEGYVARGDSDGPYFEIVKNSQTNIEIKGTGFKTSGTNVVCEPNIAVQDIKKVVSDAIIKNSDSKEVTSGNIGTGFTIKANGMTYTVVKKGDVNGDGVVNSVDALIVLKQSAGIIKQDGAYSLAMDSNKDGVVNSADALLILKYSADLSKITI